MREPDTGPSQIDERTMGELVLLADGLLPEKRRASLQQRIDGSPELAAALTRQTAAAGALRSLDLPAPLSLRERVEAQREKPTRRMRTSRLSWAGGLAAAAAAAVLVAVLVLPGGGGGPTVVQAAQLAERPATQPDVPPDPVNPKLLAADGDGVPFPNLVDEFGWRVAGERSDELDGRGTDTVFYTRGHKRIGYTIVSGEAIDPPDGATETTRNEVDLKATTDGSRQIVTWLRDGHTCVLSGQGVTREELLELASWKGEGTIPF